MFSTKSLLLVSAAWNVIPSAALSSRVAARSLVKRAPVTPQIGPGWSDQQTQQIQDAFSDAIELATYVLSTPNSATDPIFAKYFNTGDRQLVNNVFSSILGGDINNPPGNSFFPSITVVKDYPNPGTNENTCDDGQTFAATRGPNTSTPQIIICPDAGFGHGGIEKGYPGVNEIVCDDFDPQLSWKLETLGSIMLHEYIHISGLVAPPLPTGADDISQDTYGPYGSRNINKSQATNNVDNYVWYANEVLWTVLCNRDFTDPSEEDGDDLNCDDQVCTDGTETDSGSGSD